MCLLCLLVDVCVFVCVCYSVSHIRTNFLCSSRAMSVPTVIPIEEMGRDVERNMNGKKQGNVVRSSCMVALLCMWCVRCEGVCTTVCRCKYGVFMNVCVVV